MARDLRFVIIGAGMAGVLAAIKLREAGYNDFTVYEKGDCVGGTWRENTYPGLSCDVPSHVYSYSFARNPDWSHVYSPGAEIRSYFERVATEYGVLPHVRFGEEILRCVWQDGRWNLETSQHRSDEADVVIAATGVLHVPNVPALEGLDTFAGSWFHSARWDHAVSLTGQRVGVIGTGSTAVQIVAAIVDEVAALTMFQRTAQWVLPQDNPAYTDQEKAAFRTDPACMDKVRATQAMTSMAFADAVVDATSEHMRFVEDRCREHLESKVHDPALRQRLLPNYRPACKRLIASDGFYDAIQRPHAHLVTERIERVEPAGVRTADGALHELDVLVLATGFKADAFMRPMELIGRDGRALAEVWAERPSAYLSVSIAEFPNFFMLNGPNSPVGNFSLIEIAELQIAYILQLVALLRDEGVTEISATQAAMDDYEAARTEQAKHTIWFTGCRSWYLDDRGIPATWPWPFGRFREEMAEPRLDAFDRRAL